MKEKFAEFLLKRIGTKVGEVRDAASFEEMTIILDDIDVYLDTLKDIVIEAVKLWEFGILKECLNI